MLQLWEPKSIEAAERVILCVAADWITPLTHPPNERKRTSKPVAHRFTPFRGNMSFHPETIAKQCTPFSD